MQFLDLHTSVSRKCQFAVFRLEDRLSGLGLLDVLPGPFNILMLFQIVRIQSCYINHIPKGKIALQNILKRGNEQGGRLT